MTLHTRVMVTSPGVDAQAAFDKMRELIGATDEHKWFETPDPTSENKYLRTAAPGLHMEIGQGLPALMWVDAHDGVAEGHGEYCDSDCSGSCHDPAGWLEINYDTAYGYTAANGGSCSDLHAWITREITAWLDAQGATWVWYDESGEGWLPDLTSYGTLGDPEVGRPGSTVRRQSEDEKRAFGRLAAAAVLAQVAGERQ